MKKLKLIRKIAYWVILVFLITIAGLIGLSTLDIPGGYDLYVVQSGSMEPAIKRMGIVIVKPMDKYEVKDIVTVLESPNTDVTVTHRIHEIEETDEGKIYTLKGDANEDPDGEKRIEESILGKVVLTLPYLGYPVSFAQTQTGLIVLVIVPAVVIVYSEIMSIKNQVENLIKSRKNKDEVTDEKKEDEE